MVIIRCCAVSIRGFSSDSAVRETAQPIHLCPSSADYSTCASYTCNARGSDRTHLHAEPRRAYRDGTTPLANDGTRLSLCRCTRVRARLRSPFRISSRSTGTRGSSRWEPFRIDAFADRLKLPALLNQLERLLKSFFTSEQLRA